MFSQPKDVIRGIWRGNPTSIGAVCGKDWCWIYGFGGSTNNHRRFVGSTVADLLRFSGFSPALADLAIGFRGPANRRGDELWQAALLRQQVGHAPPHRRTSFRNGGTRYFIDFVGGSCYFIDCIGGRPASLRGFRGGSTR